MCFASVVYCALHPLYKLYVRLVCLRREIVPTLDGPSTPLDTEQIDHQHQHRHQHQHQHQHQDLWTLCKLIISANTDTNIVKSNSMFRTALTTQCLFGTLDNKPVWHINHSNTCNSSNVINFEVDQAIFERTELWFHIGCMFCEGGGYVRRTWCLQIWFHWAG